MKKIIDFEKIIEYAPDAMIIVNSEGDIDYINTQAEKMFGYKREGLIGCKIEILVPDRFTDNHLKLRQSYFSFPRVRSIGTGVKLFGKRSDGSEFPIEITLSPIEKEGLVAVSIRDVTEKYLNNYLINRTKQLEDYAYMSSHNLRSPVSNLISLINFYKSEETTEGKEFLFHKVEQTVEKLNETLNNLTDMLIIQEGSNKVKTVIDFQLVYNKVIANLEFQIKGCDAKINVDFSEVPTIEYSGIYLESIIQNLLSNALRYSSKERSPEIFIKTKIIDGKTCLIVKDNGLGIDLGKYGAKVFGLNENFHKHPDAKGVGLFMTKAQIESMGGKIKVESEVSKGTVFTVIF